MPIDMSTQRMCVGHSDVDTRIQEWFQFDQNKETRREMTSLVEKGDVAELRLRLCSRLQFGTAGLRARMGAGFALMNDVTIIQTSQGLLQYMLDVTPAVGQNGVVIGYDARYNSHRFAWLAANVFLQAGIVVYLYSQICPTPYVPYAVRHLHCDWGIMVTASHNPKDDNGYKVYFSNGAQIIPPHDVNIAASILTCLEPRPGVWDIDGVTTNPLRQDPFQRIHTAYMNDILQLCHHKEDNAASGVRCAYTAMHGVGYRFVVDALSAFNFPPCVPVAEQVEPDPEFPTVKFPNPEEGKTALDLAMKTADEAGCTLILANDPDADRLAVAEKQADAAWRVFTGNELGSLIGWWFWTSFTRLHPSRKGSDVYCLASTVSSRMLKAMAQHEGFNFLETLTGFKWMANKACELMQDGKTVLFAFEEAIGYMCGTSVLDKDGISAAMVVMEMTSQLARKGVTLVGQLDNIYERYGYHVSNNSYFLCYDPVVVTRIFELLRRYRDDVPGTYPSACGEYTIKSVRDLTTGYDSSQPDMKAVLPSSVTCQMITFSFDNGCIATLRTSGTEPKIKYYTELSAPPESRMDRKTVKETLSKMVQLIIEHFLKPELNGLQSRPT